MISSMILCLKYLIKELFKFPDLFSSKSFIDALKPIASTSLNESSLTKEVILAQLDSEIEQFLVTSYPQHSIQTLLERDLETFVKPLIV